MPPTERQTTAENERVAATLSGRRIAGIRYFLLSVDDRDSWQWDFGRWHAPTMGVELHTGDGETFSAIWSQYEEWGFGVDLFALPKQTKLARWPGRRAMVEDKLELCWSPEQIAGWLRRRFPTGTAMHVSHETIYRPLFVQARGGLRHERTQHLRTRRAMRRPAGRRLPDGRGPAEHPEHLPTPGRGRRPGRCPGTGRVIWSSVGA